MPLQKTAEQKNPLDRGQSKDKKDRLDRGEQEGETIFLSGQRGPRSMGEVSEALRTCE